MGDGDGRTFRGKSRIKLRVVLAKKFLASSALSLSRIQMKVFLQHANFAPLNLHWTPRRLLTQPRRIIFTLSFFRGGEKSGNPLFPAEAISNHAAHSAVPKTTRRRRPPAAKIMQGGTGKKYEVILFLRCQICSYSLSFLGNA